MKRIIYVFVFCFGLAYVSMPAHAQTYQDGQYLNNLEESLQSDTNAEEEGFGLMGLFVLLAVIAFSGAVGVTYWLRRRKSGSEDVVRLRKDIFNGSKDTS